LDFIFMLTCADRTVEDCLAVLDRVAGLGLKHVGFKDIGQPEPVLAELNRRIKATGATSYLEVVSLSTESARSSARAAMRLGVDRLMGGDDPGAVIEETGGRLPYYPFVGRPEGHPTALRGGAEDIAEGCRQAQALGCAGVDILAYRAVDADPEALIRAARICVTGTLLVAGSIASPERIRGLKAAGVDAFTMGSALFEGRFSPGKDLREQVRDVLAAF